MHLHYRNWHYKNTTLVALSVVLLFFLADTPVVLRFVEFMKTFGSLGAFVTGFFFVSTFTVVPAVVVLYHLADVLPPFQVAFYAGLGAVVGDYLIFRFFKDHVLQEIAPLFMRFGGTHISRLLRTPYFAWLAPVLGALIIASPFPDELGITLLGISNLRNWQFLVLSFTLNFLGIFTIITVHELI